MNKEKKRVGIGIYERKDKRGLVTFYISYTGINKKLIWYTVGKKSDGINLQYCKQLRSRKINEKKLGEDVSSIRQNKLISFDEIAKDYIQNAELSLKDKKGPLQRYRDHVKPYIGDKVISSISKFDIENILKEALMKGLQPATVDRIRQTISAIFNLAKYNEKCKNNPASMQRNENVSIMRKNKRNINNERERFLSSLEAQSLLSELEKVRYDVYLMVLLGLTTGARAGEILNIKFKDIDFESKYINLTKTKNNTSRKISITPKVEVILIKISRGKANDYLFQNEKGGKFTKIPRVFVEITNKLFNQELGCSDFKNRVVFHTLRHTFASWLAIEGKAIYMIQRLMGHKDISQTLRYAKLSPDIAIDAVESLEKKYL